MAPRVLVTYASKHGSTGEVAHTVAERLRSHDLRVDLVPVEDVGDLADYDAVVLGAALYTGRMVRNARRFLDRNRNELAERSLAIFAMGPLTTGDDDLSSAMKQLGAGLAKLPEIHPVTTAVFGGVVDPKALRFPFNRMKPSDARDWEVIDRWSDQLAELLPAPVVT